MVDGQCIRKLLERWLAACSHPPTSKSRLRPVESWRSGHCRFENVFDTTAANLMCRCSQDYLGIAQELGTRSSPVNARIEPVSPKSIHSMDARCMNSRLLVGSLLLFGGISLERRPTDVPGQHRPYPRPSAHRRHGQPKGKRGSVGEPMNVLE